MDKELLKIENLTIGFPTKSGIHTVVDHVNLEVGKGEIVGIVGESGSGKSMTSLAVMGLLSEEAQVSEGSIRLNGQELLGMSREERRKIQGRNMSMIFQEPMTSLNPVMKIGTQVGESLKLHTDLDKETIRKRVIETLASVGLRNPETLIDQYPHEISGGMRQRVMIAMAIINHPDLIIADEPTTALDVTVQAQILNLLKKIHRDTGSSILFISHDLNVIKEVCQKVVVMYKGVIVERGDAKEVLKHPKHEYTRKLVASMPDQVKKSQNIKKLLEVSNLNVYYKENKKLFSSKNQRKHIIHNMSFDLYEGEILGVVGESGCGKSTLAKTIVGLNKEFDGKMEMDHLKPQMVFQDPFSSLNPARKIGWIMEEPLKLKGIKYLHIGYLNDVFIANNNSSFANRIVSKKELENAIIYVPRTYAQTVIRLKELLNNGHLKNSSYSTILELTSKSETIGLITREYIDDAEFERYNLTELDTELKLEPIEFGIYFTEDRKNEVNLLIKIIKENLGTKN